MKTGKKLLKIQHVLENTLSFYRKNFFILFFVSFTVYIFFSLIIVLIISIFKPFSKDNIELFLSSANVFTSGVIYYSTSIVSHLFIFPFVLTFISIVLENNTKKVTLTKIAVKRFIRVFPLCLLLFFFITLIKIPLYVLIIIPGLIITVLFAFLPILIARRDRNVFKAISYSVSLIKGFFWKVFLFVLAVFFIREIFSFIASEVLHTIAPLYSHTFFDNLVLFRDNFSLRILLDYFFNSIASAYIACSYYFLYREILSCREK
jgi:hypothetical protein